MGAARAHPAAIPPTTESNMTDQTKSQLAAADAAALLRARNPLLWIITREEARAEAHLVEAARAAGYVPLFWDIAQGVSDLSGAVRSEIGSADPQDTMRAILSRSDSQGTPEAPARTVWIMRDLPVWLDGPGGAPTLRLLRNLVRKLPTAPRHRANAIIVLSASAGPPPELATVASVIDWPLPDRPEVAAILDSVLGGLPDDMQSTAAPNGTREAAIDAAVGLSDDQVRGCYAKSLVLSRRIDPAAVASEKKRVIAAERVLEWIDPLKGGLDSVGGLEYLKGWIKDRSLAYSPAARAYGLPAPRGMLLVGVAGCGKSMTAKAISTGWRCPLLKLDFGALKDKYVGQSEQNIRRAYRTIEALGRCVVWIDEIEKAMAGATQGAADGGVASDALGSFLTWMQDRAGECFVIATANNVDALPPELLRKGRFDEVFFVDLPTRSERVEILASALNFHGRNNLTGLMGLKEVADNCARFTGSEVASLVPTALYAAFADNAREITVDDLIAAARTVVPLSKTSAEKLTALRNWAQERARPASMPEKEATAADARRQLDI